MAPSYGADGRSNRPGPATQDSPVREVACKATDWVRLPLRLQVGAHAVELGVVPCRPARLTSPSNAAMSVHAFGGPVT